MAELKFREKGVFKSEPRARAYAETLKQKGKRVRVETQYVSGANGFGGCVPKLVSNKNFAYVYDTRAEAEAAVRYLAVAQMTWEPKIEEMR